jgi:hypothetical protein
MTLFAKQHVSTACHWLSRQVLMWTEKGPILLGCEQPLSTADISGTSWKALPRHRDEDQVQLDVNRAFVYYPNGNVLRLSSSTE